MHISSNIVEKWGYIEIELMRYDQKNIYDPFTKVKIFECFTKCWVKQIVEGFYDGDNIWKVRFMPEERSETMDDS